MDFGGASTMRELPCPDLLPFKLHAMASGIGISTAAVEALTRGSEIPLTIHEYATTGGVTLRVGDVYLNAAFDDWYCERSEALLDVDMSGNTFVDFKGDRIACDVLPLPGYLDARLPSGELVAATTMSHADRIRVSPISGCTLDCRFCDLPALRYQRHEANEMLAGIAVAKVDRNLPAHHLLVSGGSPGRKHYEWFDETVARVIAGSGLPTDVMMSPREGSLDYLDRFHDAGVLGYSFNLEVFGEESGAAIMPRKHSRSTPHFVRTVERAVELQGAGNGAVRSIVIVGLDDLDTTLRAVELIASLGADPVLSPFRPAQKTQLERWEPPTETFLADVYAGALEIAATHGVALGPRCIPCQHNTLTLPTGDGYYYSQDRAS